MPEALRHRLSSLLRADAGLTPSFFSCVGAVMRGRIKWVLASSFFINLGLLVTPLFAMLVYDKVVHNGVFETLWSLVIGVVLFTTAELTMRAIRARDIEQVAQHIDSQIDARLIWQLLRPSQRSAAQPGMAARFLTLYRDLSAARDFFSASYFLALSDLPFLLLVMLAIGLIAWPLLLVLLIWLSLYVGVALYLKQSSLQSTKTVMDQQTQKLALLTDTLSSLDTLRTSLAGERMAERFSILASVHARQTSALRLQLLVQAHWTQAAYLLCYVSLLAVGAYLVFAQFVSVGGLIAVSMLSGRVMGVAGQALTTLGRWTELRQSLKALAPYLSDVDLLSASTPAGNPAQAAAPLPDVNTLQRTRQGIKGAIHVHGISHQFGQSAPVLRELELRFLPHEKIGLLGRPGSGKSTLLRIMAGAIEATSGQVLIDHISLQGIALQDRAQWLGFKPQEAVLMAGTLESNILLQLSPDATEAQRLAALEFALYHSSLDGDLARGELSLDTVVEEYGANLSGGQRQKIALARVFAMRPRILLLDEPTSGLDTESEKMVVDRLARLTDTALIIISHSASVLALTQRLVVLQNGRLLADGATALLLQKNSGAA